MRVRGLPNREDGRVRGDRIKLKNLSGGGFKVNLVIQ